jgi:hypothetical protein
MESTDWINIARVSPIGKHRELLVKGCLVWLVLLGSLMTVASVGAAPPATLPPEDRVLPSSLELEQRLEPWCPGNCAVTVPFVAIYRNGIERLVFAASHHAFQTADPTMRAVEFGFNRIQAKVVILEGFPTAMGESPPQLVAEVHRYGTRDADEYSRGEGAYAGSLALARGIPFIGGEPTRAEQYEVLKAKGFTDADLAFNGLVGAYSQALRSGDMPDLTAGSVAKIYPTLADGIQAPASRGGLNLDAPSLAEFQDRYKELYGVDIVGDGEFPARIDGVNDVTRNGEQSRVNMMTRDRHLLGLIEKQLSEKHSVLVVYGGSHWATLSAALQARMGRPKITPFLR